MTTPLPAPRRFSPARSLSQLAEAKLAAEHAAASDGAAIDRLLLNFQRQYAALCDRRDAHEAEAAQHAKALATGTALLDRVTLPATLAPWKEYVVQALEELEETQGHTEKKDEPLPSQLCTVERWSRDAPSTDTLRHPLLGKPPMTLTEVAEAAQEAAVGAASSYRVTEQPGQDLAGLAVVPFFSTAKSAATTTTTDGKESMNMAVALRPALTDVAFATSTSVGGRCLVARRAYARGELLFVEAPSLSLGTDPVLVAPALPPPLRRSLREEVFGAAGVEAMRAQAWDPRLATAVFSLLGAWTETAVRDLDEELRAEEAAAEVEAESRTRRRRKRWAEQYDHTVRRRFFDLACPLQDVDTATLVMLDKFSQFLAAALPPGYRCFDDDEGFDGSSGGQQRRAAERRSQRRGVGELGALRAHHTAALHKLSKSLHEADSKRTNGNGGDAYSAAGLEEMGAAPYDDDDPRRQYIAISPLDGAPHVPASVSLDQLPTAVKPDPTLGHTDAVVPAWLQLSTEDIARILVILRVNAVNTAAVGAGAHGSGTLRAARCLVWQSSLINKEEEAEGPPAEEGTSSAAALHVLYVAAAMEHSCSPNAVLVPSHAPSALAALQAIEEGCANTTTTGVDEGEAVRQRHDVVGWDPFDGAATLFEVRALRPIRPGERIAIAYTGTVAPRAVTLERLKRNFFFDCRCPAVCCRPLTAAPAVDWARAALAVEQGGSLVRLVAPRCGTSFVGGAATTEARQPFFVVLAVWDANSGVPDTRSCEKVSVTADSAEALRLYRLEAEAANVDEADGDAVETSKLQSHVSRWSLTRVLAEASPPRPAAEEEAAASTVFPLAAMHYATVLRALRLATVVGQQRGKGTAAVRSLIQSILLPMLREWHWVLCAFDQHSLSSALVEVTQLVEALVVATDEPRPHAWGEDDKHNTAACAGGRGCGGAGSTMTETLVASVIPATLLPIVDHAIGLVVQVAATSTLDAQALLWARYRDVLRLAHVSPSTAAMARAAALAADPTGRGVPSHLAS